MKKVLILEDDQDRVSWFSSLLGVDVKLIWTYTVKEFLIYLSQLKDDPELVLVSMDHDLFLMKKKEMMKMGKIGPGWDDYFTDINGESGTTAVSKMPRVNCPVIVHSANDEDGPKMYKTLKRKGMEAYYFPFHLKRSGLQSKIKEILQK